MGEQGIYIGIKDTWWGNRENILTESTHGGETGKIYWQKGHMVENSKHTGWPVIPRTTD